MKFEWKSELPALGILASMFAIAAWAWPGTPERVPTHWGIGMQPDAWGSRAEGLLTLPLVTLGLYLLLRFLPLLDPARAGNPGFATAFQAIRVGTLAFLAALFAGIVTTYRSGTPDLAGFALPLSGVLMIVIGNLMGRVRPNGLLGVRTPWTLASRTAWSRTQRLGGWLLIASGLLMILTAAVRAPWFTLLAIASPALVAIVATAYSYAAWKRDPERVPVDGAPESRP